MTLTERLKKIMEEYPEARERSNRAKTFGFVIAQHYGLKSDDRGEFTVYRDKFYEMIGHAETLPRAQRKLWEDNEYLRGSDYNDKDVLEEKKLEELGYVTK